METSRLAGRPDLQWRGRGIVATVEAGIWVRQEFVDVRGSYRGPTESAFPPEPAAEKALEKKSRD